MHAGAAKVIFENARNLRSSAIHAEEVLWGYLKAKPGGFKFRRQHPYSVYILDFYCHKLKLIIEVDGSIHNLAEVKENDTLRQSFLEADGFKILRFTNDQVLNRLEDVIIKIEQNF